jgi:hypothetical protein
MELCAFCKTRETALYESDIPICLECADARTKRKPPATERDIRRTLLQDVLELTARTNEATKEFNAVMRRIPSGLRHPDGTQGIKNASSKLSTARKELKKAHTRLNDYFERGVMPDDLKGSG